VEPVQSGYEAGVTGLLPDGGAAAPSASRQASGVRERASVPTPDAGHRTTGMRQVANISPVFLQTLVYILDKRCRRFYNGRIGLCE